MAQLYILLIALGLIVGFYSKGQAFKKLGRVLLIAALPPLFIGIGSNYFNHLTLLHKMVFLLIIISVSIIIILRILFGKEIVSNVAGNFIADGLKAVFVFPFRLINKIVNYYK